MMNNVKCWNKRYFRYKKMTCVLQSMHFFVSVKFVFKRKTPLKGFNPNQTPSFQNSSKSLTLLLKVELCPIFKYCRLKNQIAYGGRQIFGQWWQLESLNICWFYWLNTKSTTKRWKKCIYMKKKLLGLLQRTYTHWRWY